MPGIALLIVLMLRKGYNYELLALSDTDSLSLVFENCLWEKLVQELFKNITL